MGSGFASPSGGSPSSPTSGGAGPGSPSSASAKQQARKQLGGKAASGKKGTAGSKAAAGRPGGGGSKAGGRRGDSPSQDTPGSRGGSPAHGSSPGGRGKPVSPSQASSGGARRQNARGKARSEARNKASKIRRGQWAEEDLFDEEGDSPEGTSGRLLQKPGSSQSQRSRMSSEQDNTSSGGQPSRRKGDLSGGGQVVSSSRRGRHSGGGKQAPQGARNAYPGFNFEHLLSEDVDERRLQKWCPRPVEDVCKTYGHVFRMLTDPRLQAKHGGAGGAEPQKRSISLSVSVPRLGGTSSCEDSLRPMYPSVEAEQEPDFLSSVQQHLSQSSRDPNSAAKAKSASLQKGGWGSQSSPVLASSSASGASTPSGSPSTKLPPLGASSATKSRPQLHGPGPTAFGIDAESWQGAGIKA